MEKGYDHCHTTVWIQKDGGVTNKSKHNKKAALGPSGAMDNLAHIEGKGMLKSWMFQIFHWLDLCLINFVF